MKYTEKLNLPIYDTPETDLFKIQEWNNGNIKIEQAYGEMLSYNEAEIQRILSEQERVSNEASRVSNENTRVLNENTRVQKEEERRIKEEERKQEHTSMLNAEALRKAEESNRVASENARIQAENLRVSKEDERKTKETERQSNETLRISKETERQNEEIQRLSAEEERKSNEIARQTVYKEIEDARKDFNGVVRDSLDDRLNSDLGYINDRFNDATLVEYDSKYISANKSYDGITKDLKVKGRTLQNIVKPSLISNGSSAIVTDIDISNKFSITVEYTDEIVGNTSKNRATIYSKFKTFLKPNTTYSIIFNSELLNNPFNNDCSLGVAIDNWGIFYDISKKVTSIGEKRRYCLVARTPNDLTDVSHMISIVNHAGRNSKWKITDFAILEGDYTNEDIPYFEGIRSVGEEGNLDVVSCGKNLFNKEEIVIDETIDSNNGTFTQRKNTIRTHYKKINKNKNYTISNITNRAWNFVSYYDINKNYIGRTGAGAFSNVTLEKSSGITTNSSYKGFKIPDNCYYIIFTLYNAPLADESLTTQQLCDYFKEIQFEEGTPTPYEPYKGTRIPITLNAPLRSLPSGTCDEIYFERGKIIRRIGKVVLNGSENWWTYSANSNENINVIAFGTIPNMKGGICICDNFKYTPSPMDNATQSINTHNSKYIYILFDKKLVSDLPSGKAYLQQNPTTVYYELATPIEEDITLPNNLRTYDSTTNIFTEGSLIESNVYCKIPSDVIALTDIRNSTVKSKIFANADERVEELEQDVKNIVTQEEWITPTLLNGWVSYGTPFNDVGYYKDIFGVVHLKGVIKSGVTNQALFNLPQGYRPKSMIYLVGLSGDVIFTLSISSFGTVACNSNAKNNWLSLDNITFRAE